MYKTVEAKNGRTMYYKDNKLISREEYELNTAEGLKTQDRDVTATLTREGPRQSYAPKVGVQPFKPVEKPVEKPKIKAPPRHCIFGCDSSGRLRQKLVDGVTVYLCEDMYNTKTTGEIVEKSRSSHAKKGQKT